MKLALDLARARHGLTGENPSVGSVIVKNDEIISIGQTSYNGRPHSEFNAIKNSSENLNGSVSRARERATDKRTNEQTNKRTNEQTNKRTNLPFHCWFP